MSKKRIANYVFQPGVGNQSNAYPNAYSLLEANKTFIKKEATAYIAQQIILDTANNLYPAAVALLTANRTFILDEISAWTAFQVANNIGIFNGYVYGPTEIAKCKRDVGYLIDALIYDIRYGGNEKVSFVASQYYLSGVVQVINVPVEILIQNQLWGIIRNNILTRVAYTSQQSPVTSTQSLAGSSAEAEANSRVVSLSTLVSNVMTGGLSTLPATIYSVYNFPGYTYSAEKCERDVGYVLDAYLNDLRYGGNIQTRLIASRYWDGEVPQVDGDRKPEIATHTFIRGLINNVIFQGDYTTKCQRDMEYLLDGVRYDITLGTNYNAVFLGLAESNSLDIDAVVLNVIQSTGTAVAALPAIASVPLALSRSNAFFSEIIDILTNGRSAADTVSFTNPTSATTSQIAAKDKLIANKDFLAAEVNAFVAATYPTADHNISKCTRDVKYAIDAICYDILYGGNSATYDQAKFFFYGFADGAPGIDPTHKVVTVAAYNRLQAIIGQVVQGQAIVKTTTGSNPNTLTQVVSGNNAFSGDAAICQGLVQITSTVINTGVRSAALAYLDTITLTYPSVTWANPLLQTAKTAIETSTSSIIASVIYTPLQISFPRQLLGNIQGEALALNRITTLSQIIISVITSGLSAVPAVEFGVTTIKLQGKYNLDELLLITNATNNQIIYNFSDPLLGAVTSFADSKNTNGNDSDTDYAAFLQVTDSITTLQLAADTSTSLPTDDIQIFVESEEQRVRPYDFGTDAIERMRVAQPQSMLDADFEYGLQPTKWQAIGVARGYPSVYEIPGSEVGVLTVVTNASAGTGGVGQSLITVTTNGAHGFTPGTPITIRALANTISGFSRAEGTFIIISTPTPTTFTYFAIAKVGTSNGQVLATTYTQLRRGAFYTGAAIGTPTFSVASNGVASSFTTKFITTVGTDQIAVFGAMPSLGVPISGTGITVGTQISGTVGPGGIAVTANTGQPAFIGDTVINVIDATGILEGMAIDNGTGTAVFVSSVSGSDITLTRPLTAAKPGNTQTYLNIPGTNVIATGTGAVFSVDRTSGVYDNLQITSPGSNYVVNTRLKILGTALGGTTPANDLTLKINTVVTTSNSPFTNVAFSSATSPSGGSGATFNVSINGSNIYAVTVNNAGTLWAAGDTIQINGSLIGGVDVVNDLTFAVATVTATYTNIAYSTTSSALGNGATFNVVRTGVTYSVSVNNGGNNFQVGDTITILGSLLGGVDGTNDLTFVVATETGLIIDTVGTVSGTAGGTGAISTVNTIVGLGNLVVVNGTIGTVTIVSGDSVVGERSYSALLQDNTTGVGAAATFDVVTDAGAYIVTNINAGTGYVFGEQLTILGTSLGGATPANDLTITVTSASIGPGAIVTFDSAGTPGTTDTSFTALSAVKIAPGTGASFDVTRSIGSYTSIVVNLDGTGYDVNDVIRLPGTLLGGLDPTNNATVTVTGVGILGNITTLSSSGTAVLGASVEFYSAVALSDVTAAPIPDATSISTAAIATIQIVFTSPHGLVPGANMLIDITSAGTNHELARGPFYVESVPSPTSLRYTARAVGIIDTAQALVGIVYARPDSYFVHRPFDGGVQLGTGGPQHGAQAIRMSKKYVRYQSGKGIMYTTGALFAPSYNLQEITADGTLVGSFITVTTDDVDHGCQVGGRIRIIGVDTAGYNGDYTISDILNERQFRIQATSTLANVYGSITTAAQVSILEWHGATVRAGTYDDQNGMFWEYNGKDLAVGRRSSTLQLSGVASIQRDGNVLTGTNTRFRDQIAAGDRIVIRGMTHVVTSVSSQTQLTVTPDYRGASNAVAAKVCLVQDLIIKQSDFNLDRLDGTGPSGYNLDITKMQMIGMQWSWYGAGFIDYMLRGADGNFIFVHRIRNSNTNTEAYMRTGNMPVRYEVINEGAVGKLRQSITATQTTVPLVDASSFPNESGIVYVDNELIAFSGKSGNTLTGCTRAAPLVNFVGGAQRTFRAGSATTHEVQTGVVLVSNTISPIISHWGSAMITDGRFDEDRGYLFNYASTGIQASTTRQTAFLIRLAPSVSNAIIGDLGERELINRAQLLLKSIAVTSDTGTGGLVIEGVLNPQNYPIDPTAISWSGLSGASAGGQPSFAQVAPGGSVSWAGGASVTTSTATTTAALSGNATVPNNPLFARGTGTPILYVTKASWDTLGAAPGFSVAVAETKYPAGTTVSSVTASPPPVATTLGLVTGTATVPNNAGFNVGANQNFVFFTQASWQALGAGLGSTVFGTVDFPANTVVNLVTGPFVQFGLSVFRVQFNNNSLIAHNANSTVPFFVTGAASTGATTLNFTQASWAALPIGTAVTGNTTNDLGKFANGTQIQAISALRTFAGVNFFTVTFNTALLATQAPSVGVTFTGIEYYTVLLNRSSIATVAAAASVAFTPAVIGANTSFLYFTQASWETLTGTFGATVGTEISDPTKFPSGTRIAQVFPLASFGGTPYYRVNFTQSSITTIAAATTVTFSFGLPPYALPGETVFSFIAAPGSAQTLDLDELKELTNTTLGGRGTYPNGPDVLAINVYRASGAGAIPTNIVIRWSEAQA
jgi:hypothetical protein